MKRALIISLLISVVCSVCGQATLVSVSGTQVQKVKAYDRTATAAVLDHGTLTGVAEGDSVTVTATATYDTPAVGVNKSITVTFALGGPDSASYTIIDTLTFNDGEITKRVLESAGVTVQKEKVFDHTLTAAVLTYGTVSGMLAGDSVTATASATYDTEDADTNKTITVTFAVAGPDSASYCVEPVIFDDGIITRRQLYRDSVVLPAIKIYDGTTNCPIIYSGTPRNYVTHHILTTIDSIYFQDPNVGVNKPVHIVFGMNGEDENNYLPPHDTTICVTISPVTLNVLGTKVQKSKVYDGTADVEVTDEGTLRGVLYMDSVRFRIALAQYDDKMVGTGKEIDVYYELYCPDSINYIVNKNMFLDGEITPIQLAAEGGSAECVKDYDTTTHAVVTLPSQPVGVLEGEEVYMNTFADFEDANVGTGKEVYLWYTIYGRDMANYVAPKDTVICTDGEIRAVVTSVENVSETLMVYPNPAYDYVLVSCEYVTIYNMSGVKVYEGEGGMIDVSGLANGVYIVNGEKLVICR